MVFCFLYVVPASSLAAPPALVSGHPKPPVTSTSNLTTTVLPAANTATVVGTNQVPSGSTQSVSVSLQSLPVILHVPVAVSSQPQLLQGHTGTLVTNQQSGNVEFISVQSSSTVGSLTKTTVSLASTNPTKPNNSPSVPSPSIQRNSPGSAVSIGTTLAVQAVSTAHPVAQAPRTLPTVATSGLHNATSSRAPLQMKIPLSAFSSTAPAEPLAVTAPRVGKLCLNVDTGKTQRETPNCTPVEICLLVYFTEMLLLGYLSTEIVTIKIIYVINVFPPIF